MAITRSELEGLLRTGLAALKEDPPDFEAAENAAIELEGLTALLPQSASADGVSVSFGQDVAARLQKAIKRKEEQYSGRTYMQGMC